MIGGARAGVGEVRDSDRCEEQDAKVGGDGGEGQRRCGSASLRPKVLGWRGTNTLTCLQSLEQTLQVFQGPRLRSLQLWLQPADRGTQAVQGSVTLSLSPPSSSTCHNWRLNNLTRPCRCSRRSPIFFIRVVSSIVLGW